MTVPKRAATRLVGFAQNVQAQGSAGALKALGLGDLTGKPISDVCPHLLDVLCEGLPGGNVDEAIARNAMSEAMAEMCDQLTGDETAFSAAQAKDLVVSYVTHTIFGRLVNDIGQGTVALPQGATDAVRIQAELVELIRGAVKDSIGTMLDKVGAVPSSSLNAKTDAIYEAAFTYLSDLAEG